MSDSNLVRLGYVAESTFGTTPSGPPTLKLLRFTSESLTQNTDTTRSQEIRSDRQTPDIIRTSIRAQGDVNGELSYGTYDDWFAAALFSSGWSSASTVSSSDTVSVDASTGVYTRVGGSWDNDPTAGQWVQISGFSNSGNNGIKKVSAATSTTFTVEDNTGLTDESSAAGVDITVGSQITNGTTLTTYVIEREYTDVASTFELFNGMAVNGMQLNLSAGGIITVTFSFLGKIAATGTATAGDGSPTAANSNSIMTAISHVTDIFENGTQDTSNVSAFSMQLANNVRMNEKVGALGAFEAGKGAFEPQGTLTTYHNGNTLPSKHLNFTTDSTALVFTDTDGNAYVFDLPAAKYTGSSRPATGLSQDVFVEGTFQSFRDSTEDVTMRIVRFPAS